MVTTGYTDCSYVKLQQSGKMAFFLQVIFTSVVSTLRNTRRMGNTIVNYTSNIFSHFCRARIVDIGTGFPPFSSFEYNHILQFFSATPFSYYEIFFLFIMDLLGTSTTGIVL
jgi:hypothetical protein